MWFLSVFKCCELKDIRTPILIAMIVEKTVPRKDNDANMNAHLTRMVGLSKRRETISDNVYYCFTNHPSAPQAILMRFLN